MSKKDIDKFPSIDNVHEVLSDLTGLFDDRNKLLDTMFREDKYKEFLLAENMQQLAEADKRDDSANGRIKKDLANGYEVLKAKTTMQKFANFISPSSIPPMDLTSADDFTDDEATEEEEAPVEKEAPEKGEKGDKGDDGADGADAEVVKPDKPKPKSRVFSWQRQQTPKLKLAEGGAVAPSPMMNSLTPQAGQRPEGKSGVKSLESLGLVGKKNVASELTEDLGLEEYKKALADAMALPLKAVAAGLAGLMDNMDVPGGEGAAIEGQVAKVGKTFGVKTKKKKKDKKSGGFGIGSMLKMLLPFGMGASRPKGKSKFSKQNYDQGRLSLKDFEKMGKGDPNWDPKHEYQVYMDEIGTNQRRFEEGDPTLTAFSGGPSLAPDTLSTQGDTKIDAMRNSITNITQGAKNMFMKSKAVTQVRAATGLISRLLGKVQPATEGSQYNNQDINSLTNQVIMDNEMNMSELNQLTIKGIGESEMSSESIMKAIASMGSNKGMGIGESDPLPPAPLRPSKHLLHSISIVDGGQTPNDVV